MDRKQIERDIAVLREAKTICITRGNGNFESAVEFKELEFKLMNQLQATERTQREFKNKNFNLIVWEDGKRIGVETKWIKEGFQYLGEIWRNEYMGIRIHSFYTTKLLHGAMPDFGIGNSCTSATISKDLIKDNIYTYTDIVKELEKADKLSRGEVFCETCKSFTKRWEDLKRITCNCGTVSRKLESQEPSIWDVIEECKGVTDNEGLYRILDKYECKFNTEWSIMSADASLLDNPYTFIALDYQLRLKEVE